MSKSLTKSLHNFTSKRVVRRSVIGVALFLLVFSIFGWLILPGIVKSQAERLIGEKLQREVSIDAVEISPYGMVLTMRNFKLMEPQRDAVFASFDTLRVNVSLQSLLRLAPVVQELRLTKPYVHLVRKDAHSYNFDDILALISSQPPSEETARFSINNIQLEGGSIRFDDQPAKSVHTVEDLRLGVPFISSLPSQVDIFVEPLLSAKVNGTPLQFKGKARPFADPKDALLDLNLDGLDATRVMEYLPFKPRFKLPSARLDLHLTANFSQPKDKAPALTLSGTAALKSVLITEMDGKQIVKLPEMAVSLRDMDVFGSRYEIARLSLNGLEANLVRDGDGALNVARLQPAPAASSAKAAPAATGFGIALGEVDIRDAAVRYADEHSARPMRAGVEKFDLALRKLAVDTGKKTINIGAVVSDKAGFLLSQGKPQAPTAVAVTEANREEGSKGESSQNEAPYAIQVGKVNINNWSARFEDRSQPEPVVTQVDPLAASMHDLSTATASRGRIELKATVNKTGQLALNGSLGLAPLHTDLTLEMKGVDILPLQPYMTDKVNLRLTRASLSGNGRLQLDADGSGPLKGGFKGDMTLGNVATVDKVSGNDFLRWKSLHFGGVDARFEPFKLAVDQVALTDFFARVIIDSTGRINLQDIARSHADDRKSLTEPSKLADATSKATPVKVETIAAANRTKSAPATTAAKPSAPLPIEIRKLTLQGGRVRFTDNFIQPNYSASLSNFGGVVTNLSSDAATSAGVELHAEVNNAPLSVAGRINPLKGDLFLDLKAHVRGMELAPLSAYSGRYVGYGIEKGRLSFEVAYLVDQRKLTAENRLILEQITFGEKIESPSATKLPVQFAVALLRDRNGVIDINLPIAGSLDDPEFSVGGILLKVIGNLIVKAVTQPFAVLGSLFGGGAELSSLEFDAGRATIPAAGEEKLKALAKALGDRPALTLDIAGRVDPDTDRPGLKRVSVERKVRAIKVGDLTAKGESVAPGSVVVQAGEYPALLLRAYKAEKFPKPRNMLGLPKDLPVEEMEKLMIANADIDDDDLVNLGNQRAQSVKNWLIKNGQVPADRMFLVAPKVGSQEAQGDSLAPNRVDFSLR